jgi:cysteine synthase
MTVTTALETRSPFAESEQRSLSLRDLIGNTPMLAIRFSYKGKVRRIYAKAEHLNLTGSIKDRMTLHILARAYESGALSPGHTIVEATSGNTGISFAAVGRALGHPVIIYMPDWMSQERVRLIQSYGATVIPVSHEAGGFLGSIHLTEVHADKERCVFLPQQFANAANPETHAISTAPEIEKQMATIGLTLDAFVAGVGTGGTIMGVKEYLRRGNASIKIHPVEPKESPTLSTGHQVGSHRIQGISDEFIPKILKLDELDEIITVSDGDSILMAQMLASTLGLGVGISSGCNFLASVMVQDLLGSDKSAVATVFCDDNKKYLSTGLFGSEPVREGYLTPQIKLLDFTVLPRL